MARLALAALAAGAAAQVAHGDIIGPCDVTIEKVNADWYHFTASATHTDGWIALGSATSNNGDMMRSAGKGIIACDSCGQDPTMFAYNSGSINTGFIDSDNTVTDISVTSEGETMTLSFMAKSMADQSFGDSNYVACAVGEMSGSAYTGHDAKGKNTVDFLQIGGSPSTNPTVSPTALPTSSPSAAPTKSPITPRVEVSLGATCTITATFLDEEDTFQFDVVGSKDCGDRSCNYLGVAVGDSLRFMQGSNEGVIGCTDCAAQVRSFGYIQNANGILPVALEDAVSNASITSEGESLTLSFRTKSIGAFDFGESRQIACARGVWAPESGFQQHASMAKGTFNGSVLTASPTAAPTAQTTAPSSAPTSPTAEPTTAPTGSPTPPPTVPAAKTGTVSVFGNQGSITYSIFESREVELTVALNEPNPDLANRGWIGVGIAGPSGMLGSRVAILDETEVKTCILTDRTNGCQFGTSVRVDKYEVTYENGQKIFTIRSSLLEGSPMYAEGTQRFVVAYASGGFGDKHQAKQIVPVNIGLGGNSPVASPTLAPISAAAGTSASVLAVAAAALARMLW